MILSKPLESLEDVINFNYLDLVKPKNTNYKSERWQNTNEIRMLVCHDLKGGYLKGESSLEGCADDCEYLFWHWWQVDTFVYFSHHLVTIPPHSWIQAAHKHGVKILGTFITEWDEGSKICTKILKCEESYKKFADKLVEICSFYHFDGWLLNIENNLQPEETEKMVKMVEYLSEKQHEKCVSSEVVWYDSVTKEGKLIWQNELNPLNMSFFKACDGIFLNYTWKESNLDVSRELCCKEDRALKDVYVGVDVFARGCVGGFESHQSVDLISSKLLSTALFAPSWTHEVCAGVDFEKRERRLWASFEKYTSGRQLCCLPLTTTFNRGHGKDYFSFGKRLQSNTWCNLGLQSLQTLWCEGVRLCEENAFIGGTCLQVNMTETTDVDLFKLDIDLQSGDSLYISFVSQRLPSQTSQATSMAISLTLNSLNDTQSTVLKCFDPDSEEIDAQIDENMECLLREDYSDDVEKSRWKLSRYKYNVRQTEKLQKIGFHVTALPHDPPPSLLLGYLQISKQDSCYLSVRNTCIVMLSVDAKGQWQVEEVNSNDNFHSFQVFSENEMQECRPATKGQTEGVFLKWDSRAEMEGCGLVYNVFVQQSGWDLLSFMPVSVARLDGLLQEFTDYTQFTIKIQCHVI